MFKSSKPHATPLITLTRIDSGIGQTWYHSHNLHQWSLLVPSPPWRNAWDLGSPLVEQLGIKVVPGSEQWHQDHSRCHRHRRWEPGSHIHTQYSNVHIVDLVRRHPSDTQRRGIRSHWNHRQMSKHRDLLPVTRLPDAWQVVGAAWDTGARLRRYLRHVDEVLAR